MVSMSSVTLEEVSQIQLSAPCDRRRKGKSKSKSKSKSKKSERLEGRPLFGLGRLSVVIVMIAHLFCALPTVRAGCAIAPVNGVVTIPADWTEVAKDVSKLDSPAHLPAHLPAQLPAHLPVW